MVTGVACRSDRVLTAPLTGRECLAYGWRAAESRTIRGLDGSVDTWGQPKRGRREAVVFVVDDGTGRLLVEPEGASLRLAEDPVDDPVADPVATEEPSLRDLADDLADVQVHGRRYYESRLDEGETVTVRGRVGPAAQTLVAHCVGPADEALTAHRVGVAIGGHGAVVEVVVDPDDEGFDSGHALAEKRRARSVYREVVGDDPPALLTRQVRRAVEDRQVAKVGFAGSYREPMWKERLDAYLYALVGRAKLREYPGVYEEIVGA